MADEVDVVVVGMGVGGEEVAGRLASAGLSVVGIENRLVGGECPYWGCVPSKMMIREAIEVEELPDSLIVLGGGSIGLELAQVFARFGVSVSVVEALDRLLAMEEPDASDLAARALVGDEIAVRTGATAARVEYDGQQFTLVLDDGQRLVAQRLLVATGRRADLGELGLSSVGLPDDARFLDVDEWLRAGERLGGGGDGTGKGAV